MTGKSSIPAYKRDVDAESAVKSLLLSTALLAAPSSMLKHRPRSFQASLMPPVILTECCSSGWWSSDGPHCLQEPDAFQEAEPTEELHLWGAASFPALGRLQCPLGPHEPGTLPTHHLQWGPGMTAGGRGVQKKRLVSMLLFYFLSFFFFFSTSLLQTLGLLFWV